MQLKHQVDLVEMKSYPITFEGKPYKYILNVRDDLNH